MFDLIKQQALQKQNAINKTKTNFFTLTASSASFKITSAADNSSSAIAFSLLTCSTSISAVSLVSCTSLVFISAALRKISISATCFLNKIKSKN